METLILLIVLAILILMLVNNSNLNVKLNQVEKELERLRLLIQRPLIETKTDIRPSTSEIKEKQQLTDLKEAPVKLRTLESTPEHESTFSTRSESEAVEQKIPPEQKSIPRPIEKMIEKPSTPKSKKEPTDIEKFVGENLISKIGIIILVLGVGFFVKYAIDQNWIGVYGRTAIGLLVGGALIVLAHFLRKAYKTFSSLLTGGGIAVFYLTIAIAFHLYQIFSPATAFVILIVVTIFSVVLSLLYDKKDLAIFSQLGGYLAPFMVSTGEGNYIVLFTYMLILNAGLLALAYYKRWYILNLLAFLFTVVIFSGWLTTAFWGKANLPYLGGFMFASAFYLVFFLVNIVNNLKERKPFKAIEIGMILSNNLFYFLSGLTILYNYQNGIYKGLFTVILGVFNFAWVVYLYRKQQIDKNLIYLLIGLVMSYISLSIPIQLNGHSITLFWTAELVILLWLSRVSGIKILKTGHLIILSLVVVSLMMDWNNIYFHYPRPLPVIFNRAFITGVFVIAGLVASTIFLRQEKEEMFVKSFISVNVYKRLVSAFILAAAFLVPFLELHYQMNIFYSNKAFNLDVYGIYTYAYLLTVLFIVKSPQWEKVYKWIYGTAIIALAGYIVFLNFMVLQMRHYYFYEKSLTTGNYMFHYLAFPFMIGIIILLFRNRDKVFPDNGVWQKLFLWFISILTVFVTSVELDNIILLLNGVPANFYNLLIASHKVGYPVLWGVFAFMLMIVGMKAKQKTYRVQALSLLTLILLKLFLFDVWSMSEGGRIAAFIFLGVLLLIVSFLYAKLKKLLLDDSKANIIREEL